MATAVHIPVSEYLRTIYHPDCDYVDGELQERNVGEQTHGLVQKMIAAIFTAHRREWGLRSITEQRVQISPDHFRIPDVCVVQASEPIVPVLTTAPLLCVEVLSPEDRFERIMARAQDYRNMGVDHVWIIDPATREAWTMSPGSGLVPLTGDALQIPGTPVRLAMADIFDEIDNAPTA